MKFNLKYGIVSEVKKGFVKVFFEDDEIVTDWLSVLVGKSLNDRQSWPLEVNEHVACLMDEHCEEGICLGAITNESDQDAGEAPGKFRKIFTDGTLIEYDKNGKKLTVDVKGSLEAKTDGEASIDAGTTLSGKAGAKATIQAPAIELTGNVVVKGSLIAGSIMVAAGGTLSSENGAPLKADVDIETTGTIKASDVKAGLISLSTHKHSGVTTGPGTSGTPIP